MRLAPCVDYKAQGRLWGGLLVELAYGQRLFGFTGKFSLAPKGSGHCQKFSGEQCPR